MPIVTRVSRNLSPLEEERGGEGREMAGGGREDVFTTLGMCVLTSRSCDPMDRSHMTEERKTAHRQSLPETEVFIPLTEEVLPTMREQMHNLWSQGIPMCIEVKGQATPSGDSASKSEELPSVLLEQWMVQVIPKRPQHPPTSPQLLLQAVRSFLHFSQLRSWQVSYGGTLPFQLLYRVCAPGEENGEQFTLCKPERHTFPPSHLPQHHTLQVSVIHLPRLKQIPSILLQEPKGKDFIRGTLDPRMRSVFSTDRELLTPDNLIRRTSDDLIRRTSELSISSPRSPSPRRQAHLLSPSPREPVHSLPKDGFPFSPPQPSPMSPKLLSGLGDCIPYNVLQDTTELVVEDRLSGSGLEAQSHGLESLSEECNCSHSQQFCFEGTCLEPESASGRSQGIAERELDELKWRTGDSGVSSGGGSSFSGSVRPPAASSPAPFAKRSNGESKQGNRFSLHRRSCAINIMRPPRPPLRCNSAPAAVPNLCLLGTFEESVLNGRLEPCGYVEGFTAELGASGSFCARHTTFAVTAAFFNLSENSGPSPYLGHIDLSGVGKRGYHVPKKGTVQLTLFNPNQTVVKIFVVTYDFSSMPPNSQTFLRQKTLSRPCHAPLTSSVPLPVLHYLIHLRFLCSKSGRVYLHRDIRLIFARRAPDTDPDLSKVSLTTITEGPSDPKYGPLDSSTCR